MRSTCCSERYGEGTVDVFTVSTYETRSAVASLATICVSGTHPRIPARSFFSGLVGANGNGGTGDDCHVSFELVAIPLVTALVFRSRGDPVNRFSRQSTTEQQSSEQRHLACRKHHSGAQFQKPLNALLAVTGLNDRVDGNLCDPVSKLERSGYESRTQANHGN